MNAVSIRLAQHTGDARREHVPQRMGKMGSEPTRDGSDFAPPQQRVLLELLDVEGSEQVTDMVAAQPVQGWQNLSCAIKRYARFGVRRFTESGILHQHRIDCFHQRTRTEDPVQAGKRRDVVEVVRGRSQVGREHEEGLSTGTQDTIDLSDGCRRGLDVLQNVVGDHHVNRGIRKQDLGISAQAEMYVCDSERIGIGAREINMPLHGLDTDRGTCATGVLDSTSTISAAEIQHVFIGDFSLEVYSREKVKEVSEQGSFAIGLREGPHIPTLSEFFGGITTSTPERGVLGNSDQLLSEVCREIHRSPIHSSSIGSRILADA